MIWILIFSLLFSTATKGIIRITDEFAAVRKKTNSIILDSSRRIAIKNEFKRLEKGIDLFQKEESRYQESYNNLTEDYNTSREEYILIEDEFRVLRNEYYTLVIDHRDALRALMTEEEWILFFP